MTSTLGSIEQRVSVLLTDLTRLNYPIELVDEGIRQALKEYSLASGTMETIENLDDAGQTSVPENDTGVIVLGATGFIAACKTLDRKEQFGLQGEAPQAIASLGERLLQRFDRQLGTVRSARLRAADVPMWGGGWGTD